jgi:DNA-binding transcriptional LysR family regulator
MRQQSDLHGLAVFSRVVETKSFSAAARSLETTTSAVSKRIATLEEHLGVRLLTRTTRRVSLTEAGTTFYAHVNRILSELAEAETAVARLGGGVRGTLRLSAPVIFGERHVAPLIAGLLERHPELRVDLSLSDRFVNLAEESIDAAVRIGALGDSSLIGVRIGDIDSAVVASKAYLEEHGTPLTPADLAMHQCVRYTLTSAAREWRFRSDDGEQSVPVTGRLQLNNGAAIASAVATGAGLARLPYFLVDEQIARGELVEVLKAWKPKPSPIHVVHQGTRATLPKVRAFIEVMQRSCRIARSPATAKSDKRGSKATEVGPTGRGARRLEEAR